MDREFWCLSVYEERRFEPSIRERLISTREAQPSLVAVFRLKTQIFRILLGWEASTCRKLDR